MKWRTDILLALCFLTAILVVSITFIFNADIHNLQTTTEKQQRTFTKEIERLNRNHDIMIEVFSEHIVKLEKNQSKCQWMETARADEWEDELTEQLEK